MVVNGSTTAPRTTGRLTSYRHAGLTFQVRDAGPVDGPPIILLHGFPDDAGTWDRITPLLTAAGRRVLAPDQRGYSPEARPPAVSQYGVGELVDDVLALADAAGAPAFDLVGHDWGGAVAWALAAEHAPRVRTLTVLSTPHPRALAESLLHSDQALRSSYIAFFQLPRVPELVLTAGHGTVLARLLRSSGLSDEEATRLARRMAAPGALSAALAWYRAARPRHVRDAGAVDVPTLYVWSTGDAALGYDAARRTRSWVRGPYRFEVLSDVSHWIQREAPDRLFSLLTEHLTRYGSSLGAPDAEAMPPPSGGQRA